MLRMEAAGGNETTDSLIDQCEKGRQESLCNLWKTCSKISKGWMCPYCDECVWGMSSVEIKDPSSFDKPRLVLPAEPSQFQVSTLDTLEPVLSVRKQQRRLSL